MADDEIALSKKLQQKEDEIEEMKDHHKQDLSKLGITVTNQVTTRQPMPLSSSLTTNIFPDINDGGDTALASKISEVLFDDGDFSDPARSSNEDACILHAAYRLREVQNANCESRSHVQELESSLCLQRDKCEQLFQQLDMSSQKLSQVAELLAQEREQSARLLAEVAEREEQDGLITLQNAEVQKSLGVLMERESDVLKGKGELTEERQRLKVCQFMFLLLLPSSVSLFIAVIIVTVIAFCYYVVFYSIFVKFIHIGIVNIVVVNIVIIIITIAVLFLFLLVLFFFLFFFLHILTIIIFNVSNIFVIITIFNSDCKAGLLIFVCQVFKLSD